MALFSKSGAKVVCQTAKTCQFVKKNALFLRKSTFFCLEAGIFLRTEPREPNKWWERNAIPSEYQVHNMESTILGRQSTFLEIESTLLEWQS